MQSLQLWTFTKSELIDFSHFNAAEQAKCAPEIEIEDAEKQQVPFDRWIGSEFETNTLWNRTNRSLRFKCLI